MGGALPVLPVRVDEDVEAFAGNELPDEQEPTWPRVAGARTVPFETDTPKQPGVARVESREDTVPRKSQASGVRGRLLAAHERGIVPAQETRAPAHRGVQIPADSMPWEIAGPDHDGTLRMQASGGTAESDILRRRDDRHVRSKRLQPVEPIVRRPRIGTQADHLATLSMERWELRVV